MTKKKIILFIVTEDWYFLSHRLYLALEAIKYGYEVHLITHCTNKKKVIEGYGIKVTNWVLKRRTFNIYSQLHSIIQLYKLIKKTQPNLIHSVAMKPILYSSLVKLITNKSVNCNSFTGLGYIFTSNNTQIIILRKLLSYLFRYLFLQKKTIVIVQNKDDYKLFLKDKIVSKKKLYLIEGSGVDTKKFNIKSNNYKNNIILLPSRMLWSKGVEEFIKCAEIVKKIKPELRFILAGSPDKENPDAISLKYLKKLKNEGIVEWVGNSENILSIYKKTMIILFPSYREGMPKSLLEASSCRIPIIAFNVIGSREIVKTNFNGLLIPFKNYQLLAKAVIKLSENKKLMNKFGENGRKLVRKKFSNDIINKKIIQLWERSILV